MIPARPGFTRARAASDAKPRRAAHFALCRALAACACLGGFGVGNAATICVGNATQLHDALASIQASTDPFVIIKLRSGDYADANGSGHFAFTQARSSQLVDISGGWSGANGSCQDKSFDPAATTVTGASDFPALRFDTGFAGTSGNNVYVHDLTLRGPNYTAGTMAACVYGAATANNEVMFERVHLRECSAIHVPSSLLENNGGTLTVSNTLVRDSQGATVGGLMVASYDGGVSRITQVTVTNSVSVQSIVPASALYVQNYGGAHAYVTNTVAWGNDPDAAVPDIRVLGTGVYFTRVHYGKLVGAPDFNNTPGTGDPRFASDNDAHLSIDSILIDSGVTNPAGGIGTFDADGKARVRGAGVDVGAFEYLPPDSIFKNGFENH